MAVKWEQGLIKAEAIPRYIRYTHPSGFRSGEWAETIGTATVNGRECHFVKFLDGVTDTWPMVDPDAGYEFC